LTHRVALAMLAACVSPGEKADVSDGMTALLEAAGSGDEAAQGQLFALLYEELRRCAHRQLGGSADRTLSTTALVHETYVKLSAAQSLRRGIRHHFKALAARAMRQVLVDQARRATSDKRGGDAVFATLDEHVPDAPRQASEVLALDQALSRLEQIDARAARVVQLHFFAGLSFVAIAELEGLNERTIKRDWQAARQLLAANLGDTASAP
jgi:RNA polymerase sigma factor (TIGR02999 family)